MRPKFSRPAALLGVISLAVALVISLAGCLPAQSPASLPTATRPRPSQTPLPTTVWFPPTPTFTALPTTAWQTTPTPDLRPQVGELILQDNFSDAGQWTTGRTGSGSIAVQNNELTLAVNRPLGYLSSLRAGTKLSSYYAEITASPTLCRDGDEYGLLLRTTSGGDFYRFSLTCDGQVRLDKYYQGKASSPQGLSPSGAAPRGAPSQSRLGVLANGKELSFFINGEYLFRVHDASLPAGGLGVFAHAAGDGAVTVNFSDLAVYALASSP
jgi:hypothetical protein